MMVQIALVENSHNSKANYLAGCRLPTFYMEDFTLLGFPVMGVEQVRELLEEQGYILTVNNGGYNISLENHLEVAVLSEFFQNNNIDTSLTDIADTFYQA